MLGCKENRRYEMGVQKSFSEVGVSLFWCSCRLNLCALWKSFSKSSMLICFLFIFLLNFRRLCYLILLKMIIKTSIDYYSDRVCVDLVFSGLVLVCFPFQNIVDYCRFPIGFFTLYITNMSHNIHTYSLSKANE